MGLKLKTITQNQKVTIRAELFAHLRVMLLFFSWAICMIAFFMWMIYAAMPNPKPDLRFSFAETLETLRKNFGTSRDADLLPPCLSRFPRLSLPFRYLFFPRLTGWLRMVHFPFRGCLRSLCVSLSQANDLKTTR